MTTLPKYFPPSSVTNTLRRRKPSKPKLPANWFDFVGSEGIDGKYSREEVKRQEVGLVYIYGNDVTKYSSSFSRPSTLFSRLSLNWLKIYAWLSMYVRLCVCVCVCASNAAVSLSLSLSLSSLDILPSSLEAESHF